MSCYLRTRTSFLILLLLGPLYASTAQESRSSVSLGADVLIPLGKLKDEVVTGFGGSAKFNFRLSRSFALTASIGFVSFQGKRDTLASFEGVPLHAGLRFYLIRGVASSMYCAIEAGVFLLTGKQSRSAGPSGSPILGVELPLGKTTNIDLSARYDYLHLPRGTRTDLGLRAAASFQL